jgi:hypothetical protein
VPGGCHVLLAYRPYEPTLDPVTQRRHSSVPNPIPSAVLTARDRSAPTLAHAAH